MLGLPQSSAQILLFTRPHHTAAKDLLSSKVSAGGQHSFPLKSADLECQPKWAVCCPTDSSQGLPSTEVQTRVQLQPPSPSIPPSPTAPAKLSVSRRLFESLFPRVHPACGYAVSQCAFNPSYFPLLKHSAAGRMNCDTAAVSLLK